MDGTSMAYTWEDTDAESTRTIQSFEMLANRAIDDKGWIACTTPTTPRVTVADPVDVLTGYEWELYHIDNDFPEAENLAAKHSEKHEELKRLFSIEAVKHNVLLLDETLDIGEDTGAPVSEDYRVHFEFTGEIVKVTIKITDHPLTEEQLRKSREAQVKAALSR